MGKDDIGQPELRTKDRLSIPSSLAEFHLGIQLKFFQDYSSEFPPILICEFRYHMFCFLNYHVLF